MDMAIETKFESWLPAFADVLMEYQDKSVLINVPASMSEWRQDVMEGANPLAEWLMERVVVTGTKVDYIVIGELKKLYLASCLSLHIPVNKDFSKLSRGFLAGLTSVTYCENTTIAGKTVRGVMRGIKMQSVMFANED